MLSRAKMNNKIDDCKINIEIADCDANSHAEAEDLHLQKINKYVKITFEAI